MHKEFFLLPRKLYSDVSYVGTLHKCSNVSSVIIGGIGLSLYFENDSNVKLA